MRHSRFITKFIIILVVTFIMFSLFRLNIKESGTISTFPDLNTNKEQMPLEHKIEFSGTKWNIDYSDNERWGPNDNLWGENVWLDQYGYMHLEIKQRDDKQWTSVLLHNNKAEYGEYKIVIDNKNNKLQEMDKNAVFGFFTYDNDSPDTKEKFNREIDIVELTRWSDEKIPKGNAEATIQHGTFENSPRVQFQIKPGQEELTFSLSWKKGKIEINGPESINNSKYYFMYEDKPDSVEKFVPEPGKAQLNLNFWLFNPDGDDKPGLFPSNGKNQEIVIKSIIYTPYVI